MPNLKLDIIKKVRDKNTRSIAIVMHNKPDGDAIGSAVALEIALKSIGKKVVDLIIHNKIHERYAPIIGEHRVNKIISPPEGRKYDVVIMVDVSDPNRTYKNIRNISKFIIVLDHHLSNKPYGNIYMCEKAASTGILVYAIIKSIAPITPQIANALYLTVRSDTGGFKNSNTDSQAHLVTSQLLNQGADIELINSIYDNKNLSFVKLAGNTLSNVQYDKKYKIIYLTVTRNQINAAGAKDEEVLFLIDQIRNVKNVDICYLFIEGIQNVRISARSKNINVDTILNHFGGGGHPKAAGCAINGLTIQEVVDKVIEFTKEHIDNNIK